MAGAPSKYKPEYCSQLIEFMGDEARPMPYEAFAHVIGVDRDTLYEWEKVHKEFSDAKKKAKAANLQALMAIGIRGMTGTLTVQSTVTNTELDGTKKDEKGKPLVKKMNQRTQTVNGFNPTTWIFMMKNMHNWKDQPGFNEDDEVESMDFGDEDEA